MSLRVTGALHGPVTVSEKISTELVGWNMSRPTADFDINETVENAYASYIILINFEVRLSKYYENDPDSPAWGNDYVKLRAVGLVKVSAGFVCSLAVRFSRINSGSTLAISQTPSSRQFENLQYAKANLGGGSGSEAFLEAVAVGEPKHCFLSIQVAWILADSNDSVEELSLALETTYCDGNGYRMITVPTDLAVLTN